MDAALRGAAAELTSSGLQVAVDQVVHCPPQPFGPVLVDVVRQGARRAGPSVMDVVSGAGHDAVYVARMAPTAMVFVPCTDGISHNAIEDAQPERLAACATVLLHAMLSKAGVS